MFKFKLASRLSRISIIFCVIYTATLGFVKNIKMCPVLINGNPTLSRTNFTLRSA